VHDVRLMAFDEMRRVSVATHQLIEFLVADAGKHGGIGDLVAVEMQDGQDGAIPHRVQELVGMPACRQRSGFGLTVADNTGDDKIRVVKRGAISV